MEFGTAAVLGLVWACENSGHFVVIAKSNRGTLYIIETQNGGLEGIYRDWVQVKNYFQRNQQVGYFITYNNSKPEFKSNLDGIYEWILPNY